MELKRYLLLIAILGVFLLIAGMAINNGLVSLFGVVMFIVSLRIRQFS